MQVNLDAMLVDVSELKSYRDCHRKWALSSRNRMHLTAKKPATALVFGTAFHACLAQMYEQVPVELQKYAEVLVQEDFDTLTNIVSRYALEVIPTDLDRFEVLAIEHKFRIPLSENITATGSIDAVLREKATGKIYGFEHKTCKNWRPEFYDLVDEQPQMYFAAIIKDFGRCDGIVINQVKKLKTKLENKRTYCSYSDEEISEFLKWVLVDAKEIQDKKTSNEYRCSPSFMKCQMCDFQPLCLEMRTNSDISVVTQDLMDIYDFKIRERDHLEEK